MKNFNLIEMAKAMKEHKLRHMWRYAAMMALLLGSVCGQAWGVEITINKFALDGTTILPLNTTSMFLQDEVDFVYSGTPSLSSGGLSIAASSTTTISAHGKTITGMTIVFNNANNTSTVNTGSITGWTNSNKTMAWSGSATSITITSGVATRINSAVITYTDATPLSGVSSTTLTTFIRPYNANNISIIGASKSPSAPGVNISGAFDSNVKLNYNTSTNGTSTNAIRIVSPKAISSIVYTWSTAPTATQTSSGSYDSGTSTWTAANTTTTDVSLYNRGSAKAVFSKIVVNFVGSTPSCTPITPTWSTDYSSTTLNVGATSSTPVVGKDGSSGAVTFSSSDTYIATVNSSGVVTGVGAGTATITATVAAAGGKCAGTVTKEFTIKAGVTYDANSATGGSVPTDDNTYAYNANITVAGNTGSLYKTGKVFNGWNTRSDGTGTHYEAGATMKMPSKSTGVTLYAEWVGYATSWEWWNCGQSNNSTTFTYITSKNYICSFASSASTAVASWDIEGGEYYRGIKIKTKDHSIAFWVQTGKRVSITFGTRPTKPTFSVGGVDKSSEVGASTNADSITVTYTTTGDTKFYIENETATNTAFTVKSVKIEDAASSCPDAWSFHSKNSSSEWRDPICMELEGDGDFYISEETAINVGDVSYKVGYQGVDEAKTTETDWQWMPMGPARNWTVGAHPTASNAGGALGYFYIHSSYTDNNRYIGFFPSSYMLRQGSGESWSNTTFNPASSAYGETVWTTPVQKYTASNAADYMYTALGTGNGGAVGCAMSTAMRPIYLKLHSDWKASSPKFYIYYFKNGTDKNGWSGLMQTVSGTGGDDLVGWIPEGDWDRVQFVRFNPGDAVASWDGNVWNSTYAITLDSEKNYYVLEAQGNGGALDWYGHWDLYHNGFYRIWVDNASTNFALHYVPQYVLEYDNNGGSGSIDPQSVALDADPNTVTVKAVTGFTAPEGKHFVNWNTAPGGGGTSYDPSDSYSLTADATLYAQWAWDTYDVSASLTNVSVKSGTTGTGAATHGSAYTVTLQGETGYNLPTTVTVTIGGSPATLTTDYTWNSSTGVLTVLAAKVTGNISISATGVAKTTAITLEAGEGGTDGSATATYGTSTITDYEPATRTGYTLDKYQDGSKNNILTKEGTLNTGNKGSLIVDSKWASEDAAVTLYAQWTAIEYTIAYNLAGGSVASPNPTSYTIESSAITLNNPTKTGYTFAGWTGTGLAEATTTVTIAAGSTGNRSYTATWTAIVPSSVSLNKTSTTITVGGTETLTATISPAVVADNTITWTSSDGTVATVTSAGVVTGVKAGTATITATTHNDKTATCEVTVAPAVTYTVTYVYNGATSGDETESATGASVTLPNPSKTGYTLQGWYTSSGSLAGAATATYNPTSNITLYALWREDACAGGGGGSTTLIDWTPSGLTKDTKSGTATPSGGTVAYSFDDPASSTTTGSDSKSYYKFGSSGNYTITLTPPSSFQADDVVHVKATSKDNSATVGIRLKNKDEETATQTITETVTTAGTPIELTATLTASDLDNGALKIYRYGSDNRFGQVWVTRAGGGSGTCYYVTYNGNGADGGFTKDEASHPSGSDVTVASNSFTKTGYTFTGWKTEPSGGTSYAAGGTISGISGNMTLYAQWAEEVACSTDPTVSAGSNSAVTSTTATVSCASGISSLGTGGCTITSYGFVIGTSTNPVIDGVGVTQHEVGTSIAASTAFSKNLTGLTKNTTYYVRPYATNSHGTAYGTQTSFTTLATYTVTYNGNGATSGDAPVDASSPYDAGSNVTVLGNTGELAKTNYTFDGWATANDGTGTSYAAAGTISSIAANTTLYAAWKQTVTLKTGAQGSGADQTPYVYINGTGVSSFTAHTADGYTLQGYYTAGSGGVKVLNANGTFAAANVTDYITSSKWSRTGAAPTLFAQWRAAGGASCNTIDHISDFPSSGSTGMTVGNLKVTYSGDKVSRTTATIYSGKTGCNVLKIGGSGTGQYVQGYLGGNEISSLELGVEGENSKAATPYCVAFSASSTFDDESVLSWSALNSQKNTNTSSATSDTLTSITVPSGAKYFRIYRKASFNSIELGAGSSVYVWHIKACTAGASTHTITYANGGGTGTMTSDADIADDGTQILKANTFTAPTNYSFAGWVADVNVTIGGSTVTAGTLIANGATITNITVDIALTAKWSQSVTLDANTSNHGSGDNGSATAYYNATSLSSVTHTKAATGYKLSGYYTAATSGTKVLNSDGSFADDNITDWIDDGKWVQNDDDEPLLYAQYEASGSIKWNLQVNSADAPIVTSSKNSSYTQISTSNMTNLDSIGLKITASKKASMTSKISAPTAFDKDKYMKVTFQVASGYQFKPSSIKVPIQPVDGGADVKLVLVDNAATPDSIGKVQSSLSKGTLTTVEMTNSSAVFKGTVTLKIYCYGSSTGTYRLGTPIQIDGEIESTCTMPSYGSVSYSQTEYVQPASASAISVVGGANVTTYQWKYNDTGDRTSGTECGTNNASYTPSTGSTGTLYYWCELTNACGTVKTPAVAITVSASKSTATVAWTDPSTPNYGGGGYTIKATVNETGWDGNASDLTITAPAGIRIYNKTSGTTDSKKWVQVKFDVQTAFDRETYSSNIPFTVSADATTSYNAISADHNVSYSACSGGGGSATEELMAVDASHIDNSTWKGGWVYDGIGMMRYGHGSSDISAGTKDANLKDLSYTMASGDITKYYKSASNHFGFYTEKAITGIRLYVYTSNDNVTVSNVYVANSAYTSGTPSSGAVSFEAEYNDGNDALRTGTHSGSAWVDITFDKEVAAEKYGQINLSNNVNIAGMAFISASGSGATLTTTLSFASSSVTKAQSDANFTITPTKGDYSETLGAITYSSSNTDCATVNATTGEVTITATGSSNLTSRITATLAASGCYKSATAYYDLTVTGQECTITSAGTLSADKTVKCSSANVTLTLSGEDDGMTVTWYRDATDVTASVSDHTLITSAAGSYSVVVSNATCSKRSNSITISNYSAEVAATKIVDKWYIKHGRVTPDIALWSLDEGTHLSSVAWSPSNATGLTAADDFYESDGIVYLKGTEPSSNESSDVEYTLTLTVKDECENTTALSTSDKQITLTHQKNTDKHVLAFVVTGTEKGGWTAGISADQTTNVELYNEIAKNFDVQATNIYSTDDEQKLKEYYSQFDILCITDYPNTGKTGTNKKSYVDAIGSLIDIRPILTMEAFVSKLDNWKSKGISGTPKSPTTRQYSMLLQCKDHEIFSGTNPTTVGSGDETMYRIDMVDKTQEEYVTLDATYGAGAHAEKSGYEYGSKPALQGFTYDASMSSLLPIGRIDDGAGNDLEVGVERQAVMEARLLVLGINGYAMERLDDDGQTIVINALKYLMKKNAEDISDCSNYFVGGAEGDETNWFNLENWSGSTLPDRTQEVRIVAPCEISGDVARAASVKIVTGGKYNRGTQTARGQLTIESNGSLIVEGKIYAAEAPNFFEQRTTEPEDLVVKADDSYTGTLIFDNEDGETQATIEMYSPSHWEPENGKYVKYWSYVGMPIKDVHIPDYFYGAFTYYFNEAKGWEKRFDNDIMQPFEGIGLSMQAGHKETFYGTMVSTENTDITITNHAGYGDGDNLIGNSWTAPIQIANFDAEDFGSCWATVYIFNTGKGGDTYVNATADNDGVAKAGQWLGIPIGVAGLPEYTGLKVIPAMNAFLVHDTLSTSTTLHLDYDKLVRDDATTNTQINEKMRAPSRHPRKKKDVDGLMRIRVVGEKTNTDVWMLQDERFSERYDNGWEAYFSGGDNRSPVLYAQSAVGPMGIVALQDLDGTVLGFAPSRDGNDYTFTFQYRGEDEYYLNDLKLQQSVLIDADNNYAFTYEKGDTNRFYVSRTPLAPQTPTGVDNASGATQSTKAIKVIYNGKLYIIRSGRVYSAEGILVK